ncbi:helix-turn-helix domain-containing protein [Dactylosporangium fulvum]|uniref:AraC family transcriptional regulator n=1 Tax=Dactylosporangium fulvum TaxID=53359 RepID=UPI0031D3880B
MRDSREVGGAWASFQRFGFAAPSAGLAHLVSRYWWARWDLRGQPDYHQLIVPYPSVQLTFPGDGPALVRGVSRGRVRRTLSGVGAAFGIVFRPGVFRRFLGDPAAALTDRALPATAVLGPGLPALRPTPAAVLGPDLPALRPAPGGTGEDELAAVGVDVREVDAMLLGRMPPDDPVGDEVAGWMARIAASSELRRVDLVAERFGVGSRHLQRLFAEHVGVSPKWVIRRFRLHEVTERLAASLPGGTVDWAGLAADLGYVDQAHLTREFTAMFGEPPTVYAARY